MTITFRAIEQPDAETVSRVLYIEKEAFGKGALGEYVIVPLLRHGRVYVAADEEGEAVASAYFLRDMYDNGLGYLMSVAVLPAYSGFDIGIALLNYAFSDLKELGITAIQLTVDPANFKALSTYREKLEFTVADNSEDEYGTGEDRLVMIKTL